MKEERDERVVAVVILLVIGTRSVGPRVSREQVRVEERCDDGVQPLAEFAPRLEHAKFAVDARVGLFDRAVVLALERDEEREQRGEKEGGRRSQDGRVDCLARQRRRSRRQVGAVPSASLPAVGRRSWPVRRKDRARSDRRRLRPGSRPVRSSSGDGDRSCGPRQVWQMSIERGAVPRHGKYSSEEGDLGVRFVLGHVGREDGQTGREDVASVRQLGEQRENHPLDRDVVLG